ncbi:hypothetical protein GF323_03000 [Candidatus Woesearchaeota archaeon]|nr:hypothetical protein [Candidatus Woesearchaeota archaeon]
MAEIIESKKESGDFDRETYLSLVNNEAKTISESLYIIDKLSRKHNINIEQIAELAANRENYISIPAGLFRSRLGPLEALVRYLKDVLELNFSKIAELLSRDETTIWTTYHNSRKKSDKIIVDIELDDINFRKLKVRKSGLIIPLEIFSERKLSILEALCMYLKENFNLSYHNIGLLVNRNERTVWTAVSRGRRKLG